MPISYPAARRDDVVDDYHGHQVPDPYRWLEDPDRDETKAWVAEEQSLTRQYLDGLPGRAEIARRLETLWDYPRTAVPFERGGRWFVFRNTGLQPQPVLYVSAGPAQPGRPLLDPNELSPDGTVAITAVEVNGDGTLLAYGTSSSGSDWRTWRVRDVESGQDLPDVLEWSKFVGAAWRDDGSGFYYGALPAPQPGQEFRQETLGPEIRFHRIGTAQADDHVVFVPEQPEWFAEPDVTDDGRYLVLTVERGTAPETSLLILDLQDPDRGFRPLVPPFEAKADVVGNAGPTFYLATDAGADRGRVVTRALDDDVTHEIVPTGPDTLLEVHLFGDRLVCHYLHRAHSVLRVYGLDGTLEGEPPLPEMVTIAGERHEDAGIRGRVGSDLIHYRVASFSESGAIWACNLGDGSTTEIIPSTAPVDRADFVTEQVVVTSSDGVGVTMFLTRRRRTEPNGQVPVLLYGYGGFNIPITPAYSVQFAAWMERGGLLAVANLRGGGEYGREWHENGRLARKQQVFDDFCACSRWLHSSGWSRPGRIAISGGSNGGLLIGASITQHPEVFGAAVADVGVFDMLRFHHWTVGWAWTSDYGNPDDPEQFEWLRAYSPLHHVQKGTAFPPTLLLTGDHDDRVVPAHSYKFAAALQAAQGADAPVLLRVETSAGHGQGKPTAKLIAEAADRLAFLEAALTPAGEPR